MEKYLNITLKPQKVEFTGKSIKITDTISGKFQIPYRELASAYIRICDRETGGYYEPELADITGNPSIKITDFKRYWSYISLEEIAKKALMLPPVKEKLTDTQVREIVLNILSHNSEAEIDYWIEYLTVNTGLPDLTDYIFYPDIKGLDGNASLEEIADKIISDMHSSNCLD